MALKNFSETFKNSSKSRAGPEEKIWETKPLINNGLVARGDMPPELVERVAMLLSTLHEHEEGRAMLARLPISRFERANDASYEVVRSFLDTFSREVRPLEAQ